MAYYDKIASKWNSKTGHRGGAFKELILNDKVISKVSGVQSKTILEIGIGNGYFMPMLLKKKSGQIPDKIYLTDVSTKNLEIAQKQFKIHIAVYEKLDVYRSFKYADMSVDLVISNMVFNEVKKKGLENGIKEINRILKKEGRFILSVLHPAFIKKQVERGAIKNNLMRSAPGLKLPVVERDLREYEYHLKEAGLQYEMEDVYGNEKLFNMKPKLKEIKTLPIGLVIFGKKI